MASVDGDPKIVLLHMAFMWGNSHIKFLWLNFEKKIEPFELFNFLVPPQGPRGQGQNKCAIARLIHVSNSHTKLCWFAGLLYYPVNSYGHVGRSVHLASFSSGQS